MCAKQKARARCLTRARSTLGACCEAAARPKSTLTQGDPLQRLCPLGLLAPDDDEPELEPEEPGTAAQMPAMAHLLYLTMKSFDPLIN